MKIFQIIGYPIDCEGRSLLPKMMKAYTSYKEAEKYKKAWLDLWDKHTANNDCLSPCWYAYRRYLDINEIDVEEKFV